MLKSLWIQRLLVEVKLKLSSRLMGVLVGVRLKLSSCAHLIAFITLMIIVPPTSVWLPGVIVDLVLNTHPNYNAISLKIIGKPYLLG